MRSTPVREFTGFHMLLVMVLFFGTIVTVNITMAIYANTSWTGLVAKNGYVASIDYAMDSKNRDAADALGWRVTTAENGGIVGFAVSDAAGPVAIGRVTGTVEPVLGGERTPVAFTDSSSGMRTVDPLPPGEWVLRVRIAANGEALHWRLPVDVAPQ